MKNRSAEERRDALRRTIDRLTELYEGDSELRDFEHSMHASTKGDEYGDTMFETITIVWNR